MTSVSHSASRGRYHHIIAGVAVGVAAALSGCSYKPVIPQSDAHLTKNRVLSPAGDAPPPVRSSGDFLPPPKAAPKPATYSVVVNEVPVRELLFALARDTKQNIDIHPGLSGLVTLNAVNETLPSILDRLAKQINLRYRTEGNTIIVQPDAPFSKTYRVNYVNMTRDTMSTVGASVQIAGPTGSGQGGGVAGGVGGAGGVAGGVGGSAGGNASSTSVRTTAKGDFWEQLRENLRAIISSNRQLAQSADDRAARAEALRTAREERVAQAEAASKAGQSAADLFATAFSQPIALPGDIKDEIVINSFTGTVTVLATEREHRLIQQYLDSVQTASQREVLIEATIAEVTLRDEFQAGVDWSVITSGGLNISQNLLLGTLATPPAFSLAYASGDFQGLIRALEQFGNTQVLSSPKLMVINNQTALLKVVDNIVYFTIQAQQGVSTGGGVIQPNTFTTTPQTVAVGVILAVTPQVHETGQVTLTIRPTITRVLDFVDDPNPSLCTTVRTLVPPFEEQKCIRNPVPQLQVREIESVLQIGTGQTVILGGLMQDEAVRDRRGLPYLSTLPGVAGTAFSVRDNRVKKTELVIFLKPTVIKHASLEADDLKFFQRFLPVLDRPQTLPPPRNNP
ncbi:MAG: secretin N-terminal domain-containing protein [Burkholderiales bacterium]|nr:secretin N-terminal domain-containing protein [Burkholderiales bacterium]